MYHSVPQMTSSIRCGGRGYRAVLKVTCLEHPVPPPLETPQGQSPPQAAGPGKEQEATAPLRTPGAGEGGGRGRRDWEGAVPTGHLCASQPMTA